MENLAKKTEEYKSEGEQRNSRVSLTVASGS
jgi:hypothetical protein